MEKEFRQMHLFSDGHVHVSYDPETMCFYRLTDQRWAKARAHNLAGDLAPGKEAAREGQEAALQPQTAFQSPGAKEDLALERLVLIITTRCNLRCRYCYAEGGAYGMDLQHMNPQIARRALDWALDLVSSIGTIQFFGGEPALNCETIRTVCEAFAQRHSSKRIDWLPQHAMVTNGTLLPAELEELVRRYQIHLTFSIDGPAEVHNANRFYAGGQGCFQSVLDHFKQLRSHGKVSLGVEMTFTPLAIDRGYGIWELAQFSRAELGLTEPHIVPVASEPDSAIGWNGRGEEAIASYRAATTASLQSLLDGQYVGFSFLASVLRTLITKRARLSICPAGASTLAIDPVGDIYPCFMFAGQPELRLGNVNAPPRRAVFLERLQAFVYDIRKDTHAACRACWARKLCTSCAGDIQLSTGALNRESPLLCALMKTVAEETMLFLGRVQSDAGAWKRFVANYRAFRLDQLNPAQDII